MLKNLIMMMVQETLDPKSLFYLDNKFLCESSSFRRKRHTAHQT